MLVACCCNVDLCMFVVVGNWLLCVVCYLLLVVVCVAGCLSLCVAVVCRSL